MRFHILTSVWGQTHWNIFFQATLPNILSENNIPKLSEKHEIVYRIFTTTEDEKIQTSHPWIQKLRCYTTVEFVTPRGSENPQPEHHVHWIHRAATEALQAHAALMIVPPDTLWNDGAFTYAGEAVTSGKKAVITPLTQVVFETLVPEACKLFQPGADAPLTITGAQMAELSLHHLHPVSCLPLEQSPHARPAIDQYWTVPGEGLVERHSQREMFAFDPARLPMTYLWYPGAPDEDILFPEDSDTVSMLSLDPLHKSFPTYILNHHVSPLDIARMSLHPLNDMPLIDFYTSRRVRWHGEKVTQSAWEGVEQRADETFQTVRANHALLRVWSAAQSSGCSIFAKLLAVAAHVLAPRRAPSFNDIGVVLMPSDDALEASGISWTTYSEIGNEEILRRFLLDHCCGHASQKEAKNGIFTTMSGHTHAVSPTKDGALWISDAIAHPVATKPDAPLCFVLERYLT